MFFPDKIKKINQKYDMMASIKQFIQLEDMLISNKFILIFLCSLLKQLSLSLYHTFGDIFGDCFGDCLGDFDLQQKVKKPTKSPRDGHRGIASDRNVPRDSHDFVFGDALAEAWIAGWLRFKMSARSSLKDVMGISRQLYQSEYEMNHIEIYIVCL